jgi:prolyl oligopeptidase
MPEISPEPHEPTPAAAAPPIETRREDCVEQLHGVPVADPYRWLEELDAPETADWIAAQNAATFATLDRLPDRDRLHRRLTELWDYEKFGVPFRRGERIFFTRNDGLQNQAVLYWQDGLAGEPRVLLDPNGLSPDGTVALTGYSVSEDGRLLAYGLSSGGSDWQVWHVREVDGGHDRPDRLEWVKFSRAGWAHDGSGFTYSRYDAPPEGQVYKDANYNQKVYFHRLGTPQSDDELVYARPDHPDWGFDAQVSEDGRYLVLFVWKGTHRENALFYRDLAAGPEGPIVELLPEFDAQYDFVGNDGALFYLQTDRDAPLGQVVAIDLARPAPGAWRTLIPERADALQGVSLVADQFLAIYLHDAYNAVRRFARDGQPLGDVALPGLGSLLGFSGRRDQTDTFYHLSGFTNPGVVYRYDLTTERSEVFREPRLAFDPDDFVTEQASCTSADGTRVPLFLSYRRGLVPSGDAPVYLFGYGGFNIPLSPLFSVANLVWMEQGGIYAQAVLRGGGEFGKHWHLAGTRLTKQNSFDDFIAAAEWLIASGYTRAERLAIGGRSNGGLLVGACVTQRPELFGACLIGVGVLDMLRFHRWTIGWGWVSDYGSPDDPDEFRALLAYSPYHNLRPGTRYPPTLIVTGDHDDRVFPAHSFKFAAALQRAQGGPAPVLIRIETRAGHGLGKPTAKLIAENADSYAFLMAALAADGP